MANNSDIILASVSDPATSQTVFVADLISEGPIEGLVNGEASVYLNEISLMDDADATFTPNSAVTVQFSGSATGTFSSAIKELTPGVRFLHLRGVDSVSGVTVTHTEGSKTFTLTKTATDFTTYKTFGTATDHKKWARLVRENVTIQGQVNESGVFISENPITSSYSLDDTDYTLFVDEAFVINSITTGSVTVGTNTPPSGTYSFYIGVLDLVSDDSAVQRPQDTQKINNTNVQFREGYMVQAPLAEVGGVGGTPSYAGNAAPGAIIQVQDPETYGLPSLAGANNWDGYPSGNTPNGSPITMAATGVFNLSSAQIAEVDELRIPISYNSMISNSENTGNEGHNGAVYDFSIRTQLDGIWDANWQSLYPNLVTHYGQRSSPVSYEHTIQLEPFRPFDNFEIRIIRLTRHIGTAVRETGNNAKSRYKGDTSSSIGVPISIFKEKFIYPNTAYAGVTFSSETYSSLPQRTYDCKGMLVKVPTTYTTREALNDPLASTDDMYSGFWGGDFKPVKEYTDNPAWVFYDIVSNNRYGAGDWIAADEINKYALYRIARYCDELVDDGNGGLEPRFRANVYLTKGADVYKVLKDMATIFTGMLYFLEGQVTPVMDSPADPVYNFSKGNVIEGVFNYESTGAKTRVNQVVVSWNNPANNYATEALVVEDRNAILRANKIVSQEAVAFGATSEGQATRYGRWKLYTAQYQTEIINFKTSLAGGFLQPGDIISVQDADRYGVSLSGRLKDGNTQSTINLDRTVTLLTDYTYELSVLINQPAAFLAQDSATISAVTYNQGDKIDGVITEEAATSLYDDTGDSVAVTWKPFTNTETRTVTSLDGDRTTLTVGSNFSATPDHQTIWLLKEYTQAGEQTVHSSKQYRILGISEEAKNEYAIAAVEHFNEKYAAIEEDYALAEVPDLVFPEEDTRSTIPAPENLYVLTVSDWTKPKEELKLQWDTPDYDHIAGYEIRHNVRGEDKIIRVGADRTRHRFNKVEDGSYVFRVRTVSSKGNVSKWTAISIDVDDPFGDNVARLAGGIAQGAVSSVSGFINANNEYRFEKKAYVLAPIQNAFDPYVNSGVTVWNQTNNQDISGINRITVDGSSRVATFLTSFFIYFDRAGPDHLKVVAWDFVTFKNLYYWYDAGNGSDLPTFSALTGTGSATIAVAKGSNKVVGTNTLFTTELEVGDILEIASGVGARVASIVDDELLFIDRSFPTAYTTETPATTSLQIDFEEDCIISRVYWDGAAYHYDNYLTIDPDLANLAKSVYLDSNIQFINYDSDENQETSYSNITLVANAAGFKEPEFQVTGSGFAQTSVSADAGWTEELSGQYTKVVHDNSDIDYLSGAGLSFDVTVREANDPTNVNKQRTSNLTVGKVIGGSIGNDAKTVQLTAQDYSIVYDAQGENPLHNGAGSTITLTATSQGFLDPRYTFTIDGVAQPIGSSSTDTFTVPNTYFDTSKVMSVEVEEQGSGLVEAFDNITIHAVKPGTEGYTVILSNEAHAGTALADGSGVDLTGSGGFFEVFKGATQLTFVAGLPGEGQYSVIPGTNSDLTPSTPVLTGQNSAFATIPDFTDMVDDTETISYTINAENIAQNIVKKQSFGKAKKGDDGSNGEDGRAVRLKTAAGAFKYDEAGLNPQPSSTLMTAVPKNTVGTVYYRFLVNDVEDQAWSTTATYPYTPQTIVDNMPDQVQVQISEDGGSTTLAEDEYTLVGLEKGSDAFTVVLTNEAHTIPVDDAGLNGQYGGSGTGIRVWYGTEALDYAASGNSSFSVGATGSSITVGSASTTGGGKIRSYGAASAMTADIANISFGITARDPKGNVSSFEKLQTFSKSYKGATGDDGATGPAGGTGAAGDDGDNVANGVLYFQTVQSASPVAPSGTYTFSTNSENVANWDKTPPQLDAGTSDTVWHAGWSARGANGANTATMVFGPVTKGIVFSGLVSFTQDGNGDLKLNDAGTGGDITQIYGGDIRTGTIATDRLTINDPNTSNGIIITDSLITIIEGGNERVKLGLL